MGEGVPTLPIRTHASAGATTALPAWPLTSRSITDGRNGQRMPYTTATLGSFVVRHNRQCSRAHSAIHSRQRRIMFLMRRTDMPKPQ